MTILLRSTGSRVVIRPDRHLGDEHFRFYIQAVAGARFDGRTKEYVATIDKASGIVRRLRGAGFDIDLDETTHTSLERFDADRWIDLESARDRLRLLETELAQRIDPKTGKPMRLYPFQKPGVEWLATRFGGVLADDMGLGKSIQILCALPPSAPTLVICPAVMKSTWLSECRKWRPSLRTSMLKGRGSFRFPNKGDLVVTNFDILPRLHKPECKKVFVWACPGCHPRIRNAHLSECKVETRRYCPGCSPDFPVPEPGTVVVVDEAHIVRNAATNKTESTRGICRVARQNQGRVYLVTGTPVNNRPDELWSVLEVADLAREAFGTHKRFVELMGGTPRMIKKRGVETRAGYTWSGKVDPSVSDLLQRVLLRRRREDVLPDLPRVSYRTFSVDIDEKAIKACDRAVAELGGNIGALVDLVKKDSIPFKEIAKVRAILAEAKTPSLLKLIETEYEDAGEPVVVFSAHRHPIDMLGKRPGWATITGDTSAKKRGDIVERFQNGELAGIGLTIAAGGVGITLTRSCYLVFVDLAWSPSENAQARDRIVRIGQTRPCMVTTLVSEHALDQRVTEVLEDKMRLIDASVEAAAEGRVAV